LISNYGGLQTTMPEFTTLFFIGILANMAFPGSCNFIGEMLLFTGIFENNMYLGILATPGIFLCATYSIWLFNRICCGSPVHSKFKFHDLSGYETAYLTFLLAMIIGIGLNPGYILELNYSFVIYFL
jgi:NADH-quinone oxidoreductase subunit M